MATCLLFSHQECLGSGMAAVTMMDCLGAAADWDDLPGSWGPEAQVEAEL